jgi:hypothetical protein
MNHVPDAALAAIDELGRATLRGKSHSVETSLRSDFAVRIVPEPADLSAGVFRLVFRIDGQAHSRLRDHGRFVVMIVRGIERRLMAWGIDPPDRYRYSDRSDRWCRYTGIAHLPRAD